MKQKWLKFFIPAAGAILLAAALCRFLIAAGHAQVMTLPDPMLGIPLRDAVVAVGVFELVVALICLFGKRIGLQLGWLAWLGTNYVVIWIGLLTMHIHPQATCIGSLTDPLHLSRGITGYAFALIPFGLALGSYAAVVSLWFSSDARTTRLAGARQLAARHGATTGLSEMVCPACGGPVKFAAPNVGLQVSCPQCHAAITLRKPDDNLKMTCVLCGGHIEFPAHAVGQRIQCPHCKMNITLRQPA
jgi:DNA-directed RNA polymerase subunit RPC12/RpoP